MKSLQLTLLAAMFFTLPITSRAQTWSDEPAIEASQTSLKLIGRGFQDRETQNSFALTCTEEFVDADGTQGCKAVRHVYFEASTAKAYLIGKTYKMMGDADEMNAQIKEINQKFKSFRRQQNRTRNFWIIAGGGMAIAPTVFFVTGGAIIAFPISVGVMLGWAVVGSSIGNNGTALAFSPGGQSAFRDVNGWNWASIPNKISHKKFKAYKDYVDQNHTLEKFQQQASAPTLTIE